MFAFAKSTKELMVSQNMPEAEKHFVRALSLAGKMKQPVPAPQVNGNIIKGRMSYGLQRVPVTISLSGKNPAQTHVVIEAKCDDIAGEAAKQSIELLLKIYDTLTSGHPDALQEQLQKDAIRISTGLTRRKIVLAVIVAIILTIALCAATIWFLKK